MNWRCGSPDHTTPLSLACIAGEGPCCLTLVDDVDTRLLSLAERPFWVLADACGHSKPGTMRPAGGKCACCFTMCCRPPVCNIFCLSLGQCRTHLRQDLSYCVAYFSDVSLSICFAQTPSACLRVSLALPHCTDASLHACTVVIAFSFCVSQGLCSQSWSARASFSSHPDDRSMFRPDSVHYLQALKGLQLLKVLMISLPRTCTVAR